MTGAASIAIALTMLLPHLATAQGLTLPPSGDNQRSEVTQHIGPVTVSIGYNSPDVRGPNGEDRRGRIFGTLVPYGIHDLGFAGRQGPWRAGSNENTVFTVSHPVTVQGQPLPAGRYGLHMIAGPSEWVVIFSKNATSWGSFTYDQKEDQLRVTVTPEKAPYREWLSYEFLDRKPDRATVALEWDELRVPFTIAVPDMASVYLTTIRNELRSSPGFTWQAWQAAALYCLRQNVNLDEALTWADNAIRLPGIGQANFATLETKAAVLSRLSRASEAAAVMEEAMRLPNALPTEIHQYGRELQAQGKQAEAMAVYQKNAARFGEAWPTHVGMARGYSAAGDFPKALEHAQKALAQAPDPVNKKNLEEAVARLKQGRDMNATR
jgi:Protein of unknown function (DUF2911)